MPTNIFMHFYELHNIYVCRSYCVYMYRQWCSSIVPGLSSGILWAAGNIMSVHASWFLGKYVLSICHTHSWYVLIIFLYMKHTCIYACYFYNTYIISTHTDMCCMERALEHLLFQETNLFDGKSRNCIRVACGLPVIILGFVVY